MLRKPCDTDFSLNLELLPRHGHSQTGVDHRSEGDAPLCREGRDVAEGAASRHFADLLAVARGAVSTSEPLLAEARMIADVCRPRFELSPSAPPDIPAAVARCRNSIKSERCNQVRLGHECTVSPFRRHPFLGHCEGDLRSWSWP